MEIDLSSQDYEQLMRPVAGSGGWQSLLRKLQRQVDGRTLTITPADSQRILRYILSYGSGGWQDRLAGIAGRRTKKAAAKKRRSSKKR